MRRLTIEALRAGAFGFTTSRTDSHKTPAGDMVPVALCRAEELMGIGAALGAVGAGAFGMNSDFDDETSEFAGSRSSQRRPAGRSGSCSPTATRSGSAGGDCCSRARGARAGRAADRADRRTADRRDAGHRHCAQSVLGAAELSQLDGLSIPISAGGCAIPNSGAILSEKPSEEDATAGAVPRSSSPRDGTSSS